MEAVFKALADDSRRLLLDRLFERDGQTLVELTGHLAMSRYGVMKHLAVLEAAGLVATRKVGRHKFQYLNPLPIREMADRWISKYAAPWARALAGLKTELEGQATEKPAHVFETDIRTTPEALWDALTNPAMTQKYFHETSIESDFTPGAPYRYRSPSGGIAVDGAVLECDPPRRLVPRWCIRYDAAMAGEPPSRVTYEIEPAGEPCKLTVIHDEFEDGAASHEHVGSG
jgi:uncharacterized protein YndB with AHSA1/START domain/DNA-binding transcriptional ArsR family regulator